MFFMRALALLVLLAPPAIAQDYLRAVDTPKTELLWPGGAPGAVGAEDLDKPAITFYQPAKPQATGTIVVICPGGGYGALAMDHEGHQVARWLTAQTPPTFLFHTTEDTAVPPQNSIAFYLALKHAGVPAELHIYEKGSHGVGLAPGDRELSTWPDRLLGWMRTRGLLER